jgi:hypothetical protein
MEKQKIYNTNKKVPKVKKKNLCMLSPFRKHGPNNVLLSSESTVSGDIISVCGGCLYPEHGRQFSRVLANF